MKTGGGIDVEMGGCHFSITLQNNYIYSLPVPLSLSLSLALSLSLSLSLCVCVCVYVYVCVCACVLVCVSERVCMKSKVSFMFRFFCLLS